MNKFLKLLLILLLTISITACSGNIDTKNTEKTNVETTSNIKVSLVLKNANEEISSKEYYVKKDENLLTLLKNNLEIEENNGFITSINGKKQNPDTGTYWMYTINDKLAEVGAGEYILQDNDKVVFTLDKVDNEN